MQLPPLPQLDERLYQVLRGPSEASNWVIPGMLLCGQYPGALEDRRNDQQLKRILAKRVDTFVCLQSEVDNDIPEEVWRTGIGLRPYFWDAQRLSKKQIKWIHIPIDDGLIAPDDMTLQFSKYLANDIVQGRVLYLHCLGGHGRTAVFVCLILIHLYRISAAEALKRVQLYHDCRVEPQGAKSPQTVIQRDQVKRLARELLNDAAPDVAIEASAGRKGSEIGDAGKRGSMKPLAKSSSCPALRQDICDTPTTRKPPRLKTSAPPLPEYLQLPDMPSASAKTRRDAALRLKSAAAAMRRRPSASKTMCADVDSLADEFRSGPFVQLF